MNSVVHLIKGMVKGNSRYLKEIAESEEIIDGLMVDDSIIMASIKSAQIENLVVTRHSCRGIQNFLLLPRHKCRVTLLTGQLKRQRSRICNDVDQFFGQVALSFTSHLAPARIRL